MVVLGAAGEVGAPLAAPLVSRVGSRLASFADDPFKMGSLVPDNWSEGLATELAADLGPKFGSTEPQVLHFIGMGEDARGGALITLDEITQAADEVGARMVTAEGMENMPKNHGRLWLGRYGSGAIPGHQRFPGKPGLELLEGYAKYKGGRTGAISLTDVPRADWFSKIQPLIDQADEVMFHVSTGVGVVDEATGIQYLTSEELMYVLNNPAASSKTVFFTIENL